jgi:hypothetical protein
MANLHFLSLSAPYLHIVREQNPFLSDSLLNDCNYEVDKVAAMIEPLLDAPQRCRVTSLYVQAVTTGKNTFLATNLVPDRLTQVTPLASTWLIGRSLTCSIPIKHKTVSRCHALVGYRPSQGLYIEDMGSSNGTWVNQHRLMPEEQRILGDGDLIQLGKLQMEFFLVVFQMW